MKLSNFSVIVYIMEPILNEEKSNPNLFHPHHKIHSILAHSYSSFFLFFVVGVVLDLIFSVKIFHSSFAEPVGIFSIVAGSLIILWAQRKPPMLHVPEVTTENFCRGPYCYSRNPTHWGLFFLVLGFGIIANAFFVVVLTVFSFLVSKLLILRRHDMVMRENYGQAYKDYKRKVKF